MRRIILVSAVMVLAITALVLRRHRSVAGSPPQAHSAAPDFSLPELNGRSLQLSSYRGKVVLLDFWATWCTPCQEEIPLLVELQSKYRDQGMQVIGVSMDDTPGPVREFYRRYQMNYPVVMGNAETGERYGGILGLPIAFVIDRQGLIYTKHIGATDISVLEQDVKASLSR